MKELSMSSAAFGATLHLLKVPDACLLPAPQKDTDAFLQGREALCENGWAELDFDGKVTPTAAFARLLYDISNAQSAMRLEQEGCTVWYLLAPTEMLLIRWECDTVYLCRKRARTFLPWVRETILPVKTGTLTTAREEKSRQALIKDFSSDETAWGKEIVKHMALFFGKEENDA